MNTLLIIGAIVMAGIVFWCWDWVKKNPKKTGAIVAGTSILLAQASQPIDTSFQNLPNVAKEQGIYRITYNKWSDVEIGDKDMPEVKLRKWGDETFIKLSYPDFSPVEPKQDKGKLKWVNGDKEVHLYQTKVGEIDAFEFEIILNEDPRPTKTGDYKIVIDIESKGLNFYYQPELTQKEIDEGGFRPENVVGSYAVYHATKGNMHAGEEAEKYKVSKAFHIYRPRINDVIGNWAWSEQEIIMGGNGIGQQIIIILGNFLDTAVYPVRHAGGDTLGYTTIGGSLLSFAREGEDDQSRTVGNAYSLGTAGTLDSMSAAATTDSGTENVDLSEVIYKEDSAGSGSHDKLVLLESLNVEFTTTAVWKNITASSESLPIDDYVLAVIANGEDISGSENNIRIAYDRTTNKNWYQEVAEGSGGYATRKAEDPWTEVASVLDIDFSIYASYSTEAPPAVEEVNIEIIIIDEE